MPTEIINLTALTLWPLLLAVVVWVIANHALKDTDEISVADVLTRRTDGALSPKYGFDLAKTRAAPKRNVTHSRSKSTRVPCGRTLGAHSRLRRMRDVQVPRLAVKARV